MVLVLENDDEIIIFEAKQGKKAREDLPLCHYEKKEKISFLSII
jgi:hypothetical protein